MIKANKGMVQMEGAAPLLEAELVTIVKGLYKSLAEGYGEEFAKARIKYVFNFAMKPDEEIKHAAIKDIIQEAAEFLVSAIKGEEKEGEK